MMLTLGIYWSIYLYLDWQDKPVLTTVTTTALPISQVEFPAITICSEGKQILVLILQEYLFMWPMQSI